MSSVRELHDEAMRLAQLALVARHHGESERAEAIAREAYEYETRAAHLVPEGEASEPTRSILFRSAASLAFQCGELKIAQRLIAEGLSGYPPAQVETELKELYEQVNFELDLKSEAIIVEADEMDIRMCGKGVGFGAIRSDEFVERIEAARKLIDRTVQRLMGREYQRRGAIAEMYKAFVPLLYTPRAGSFAVTLKLGRAEGKQIPLFVNASRIIQEIMMGIELINSDKESQLHEHIPQKGYYQQFLSLTRNKLAPDGEQIRYIQFTSQKSRVTFTRTRDEIPLATKSQETDEEREAEVVRIEGVLDYAKSKRQDEIGITTEEGTDYKIVVEEGMDDLVLSHWKHLVIVTGLKKGDRIVKLLDIKSVR
jgi:hypothetical protein